MAARDSSFDSMGRAEQGRVTRFGRNETACQQSANLLGRMPRKELSQVLAWFTLQKVGPQQPLDGIGNLRGNAAIADRSGDRLVFAHCATDAEVVSVHEFAVVLQLLAFQP